MESAQSLNGKVIYIVSSMKLQNSLIISYLKQTIGMRCVAVEDLSDIPQKDDEAGVEKRLILLDCMGKGLTNCEPKYKFWEKREQKLSQDLLCIFNLHRDESVEEEGLIYGVKGFFYMGDPIEQFLKGIQAVFEGELWLPRKIMTRYILHNQRHPFPTEEGASKHLTPREIEIITMIGQGSSNSMIADQLFISPHTVKTHIYNIFKKIKVPNRLQAAFWAIKNI